MIFAAHDREQDLVCGHKGFASTGNRKCKRRRDQQASKLCKIINRSLTSGSCLDPLLPHSHKSFLIYLRDFRLKHGGYFGHYSGLYELSSLGAVPAMGNRKPVLSVTHIQWRSTS